MVVEADVRWNHSYAVAQHRTRSGDGMAQAAMQLSGQARESIDVGRPGVRVEPSLMHGRGAPLPSSTRAAMEHVLGGDFSAVRVHEGSHVAKLSALAYAQGEAIHFAPGRYQPGTPDGDRLVAHELVHVAQQRAGRVRGAEPHGATAPVVDDPQLEAEAEALSPPGRGARAQPSAPSPKTAPIQRQPVGRTSSQGTPDCPPMEAGEREEAAKAKLQLIERIKQTEWLIYGFPIGSSEISEAESGGFIAEIVKSLQQGHFVYQTGQDPLEVLGFSDCFAGQGSDNPALRQARAAHFCAGVKDHYAATPKTYPALIPSCEAAPAGQFVESNAKREGRAKNRSILIRRAPKPSQAPDEYQGFPYNPKFGPSEAHCAAYTNQVAREILGPIYPNNAHCSCLVTPDEPHNNCVRHCLQEKMWNLLANAYRGRKPGDPPMDMDVACLLIWQHHVQCYHACSCGHEFIGFPAFDGVCNVALPCAVDSAAINVLNRCMPAPTP